MTIGGHPGPGVGTAGADDAELEWSPSGRYRWVKPYADLAGTAREAGRVYAGDRLLGELTGVRQLFSGWVEGHASGHDYALFSSDEGHQTVIELDTGRRVDWPRGGGPADDFIRCVYHPPPDRTRVVVDGCYWA